jgi:hypothetical protein
VAAACDASDALDGGHADGRPLVALTAESPGRCSGVDVRARLTPLDTRGKPAPPNLIAPVPRTGARLRHDRIPPKAIAPQTSGRTSATATRRSHQQTKPGFGELRVSRLRRSRPCLRVRASIWPLTSELSGGCSELTRASAPMLLARRKGVRNGRRECCSVGRPQFCFWRSTTVRRRVDTAGVTAPPSPAYPRVRPRPRCPPWVAPWAPRAPSPAYPRVRPRPRSCPGQPQQREWGSSAERPAAPSEAAPLTRSPGARSQGATESGRPQLPCR